MNSERKAFLKHWYISKRSLKSEEEYAWEAWQASAQRQGYKLVPVEPKEKSLMWLMYDSGFGFDNVKQAEIFYKAMIGAVDE